MTMSFPLLSGARGITLIEVLVTLVVSSLGLLGVAILQGKSLQAGHDAQMYSQAAALAYDIAERMRTNDVAVAAGNYNIAMGTAAGNADCYGNNCNSAAALAAGDLYDWKERFVKTLLPDASASLSYNAGTKITTIIIRWQARGDGNCDSDGASGTTYRCFTLSLNPVR